MCHLSKSSYRLLQARAGARRRLVRADTGRRVMNALDVERLWNVRETGQPSLGLVGMEVVQLKSDQSSVSLKVQR